MSARVPAGVRLVGAGAAAVAALAYSAFLLEGWLDPAGWSTQGFISELSEPGHPGAAVYRWADRLAGVALVLAALVLARAVAGLRHGRAAAVLLGLVGAGSLLDAAVGMGCDPSVDAACEASVHTVGGMLGALADVHTLSALLAFVGCSAGPVLLGVAVAARRPRLARACTALGAVVGVLGAADLVLLLVGADPGAAERLRTLASSGWFLAVAVLLVRAPARRDAAPARDAVGSAS